MQVVWPCGRGGEWGTFFAEGVVHLLEAVLPTPPIHPKKATEERREERGERRGAGVHIAMREHA
jgi:hypothetical protein